MDRVFNGIFFVRLQYNIKSSAVLSFPFIRSVGKMNSCRALNIVQSMITNADPSFGQMPDFSDLTSSLPPDPSYFKYVLKVCIEFKRQFKSVLFIAVIIYPDPFIAAAVANELASSQVKHEIGRASCRERV